jgi:putative DNA primase/helicase
MITRDDFEQLAHASEAPEVDPLVLETEEELIERLAGMTALAYERTKKAAAERLGLDQSGLKRVINEHRKRNRSAGDDDPAGGSIDFEEVEPWPEELNGAALLSDVALTIHRFVICQPETAHAAALWSAMTWLIDAVQVAPIANITAPDRNCGKSVMLTTLGKLASRPLMASNITPAALFRAVEQWRPTLLIDEADAFADENEELRGIINSGHTRDTAFVVRVVGDDHEPRRFATWGAKAMAGIGKRAGTIESRAIPLRLRRKLPHEYTERLRSTEADRLFAILRRKLARWCDDITPMLAEHLPALPDALQNRNADNWEPLLSIADMAGGDWPKIAVHAALALSGVEEAPSLDQELLGDIREVFETRRVDKLSSADLLAALIEDEEKSWATYNRGRPMTPKQLSQRLKGYGIKPAVIRVGIATPRGYRRDDFQDAFARYLDQPGFLTATAQQPNNGAGLSVADQLQHATSKSLSATLKPLPDKACDNVADRNPATAQSDDEWANDYAAAERDLEEF